MLKGSLALALFLNHEFVPLLCVIAEERISLSLSSPLSPRCGIHPGEGLHRLLVELPRLRQMLQTRKRCTIGQDTI